MFTDAIPCQDPGENNDYVKFKNKHILSYHFDTNSREDWAEYLTENRLCGTDRPPLQSFLSKNNEDRIKNICNGEGIIYRHRFIDNLCISREKFTVYTEQQEEEPCEVETIDVIERYVVVACNVVVNQCLPVHYQKQTNRPRKGQICRPPHIDDIMGTVGVKGIRSIGFSRVEK
ncbi:hypothetical protein PO909_024776 [Leuciscus waleckii]